MQPAERIIGLYRDHAADWDARRGDDPRLEKAWLDGFLEYVPPGGHLLDLGCGSGRPVAAYLIQQRRRVTGVDASEPLIELCRQRFPEQTWRVADMRGLDLGQTFDGLIAWHSSFHLTRPDQRALFAVYARHVAPGGALMFTSGHEDEEAIGEWQGEPLYHASLSSAEYRQQLDAHGFEVIDHVVGDYTKGEATVWLARRRVSD